MAFSPPEYCRLFAQKKAYQGGVTGTPGTPPSYAPGFAGIAAAMFAFTHPLPPILAEKLSSKLRFFIQNSLIFISSQTWDCDVLGSKKLCGKSISSGSWSSRSNVKTSNRKPDGKTMVTWLLDVRCSRKMSKTSILRFLLLNLFSSRRPM